MDPITVIIVTSTKNKNITDIKAVWKEVYKDSSSQTPFSSWYWIEALLKSTKVDYHFLCATLNGKAVGVSLLFFKNNGLKKVAYLNRTGNPKIDQPWIEYNDFLCDQDYQAETKAALIDYCVNHLSFDELVVGASLKSTISALSLFFNEQRTEWYSQTYKLDLSDFSNIEEYLSSLSSNTRYQIRRAYREYCELGEEKIERASDLIETKKWMRHAAPHHIKRWGDTRVGSGFNNPHFIRFHEDIIAESFDHGYIDLLTISFGKSIIAYFYNFIINNRVYFYLSANVYTPNIKYSKPGLVAHTLAIEYYLKKGFHTYDFMGGESQYKRSLASYGEPMSIVRFQRKNTINWVEQRARRLKQLLFRRPKQKNIPKTRLLITGGELLKADSNSQYNKAIMCIVELSESSGIRQISRFEFTPKEKAEYYSPKTNIVFKSASLSKNHLYVPTETEIKVIDVNNMKVQQTLSLECFNDLHHVIEYKGDLFIANTGMDCVTKVTKDSMSITHYNVVDGAIDRVSSLSDVRRTPSTKPHLAHPNFCFILNNEVWVTRCDFMDAVTVNKPRKRIFIGDGLVHDGVVYGKHIYFTTVNGHIKIFDKQTTKLHCDLDLRLINNELNGWFRGICPVSQGKVVIAMSRARASKRLNKGNSGSTLLLVDIYKKEILQKWDVGSIGLDAVFSVIEVPQK